MDGTWQNSEQALSSYHAVIGTQEQWPSYASGECHGPHRGRVWQVRHDKGVEEEQYC